VPRRENPWKTSWKTLASFLCILVKASCAGLKSYFSAKTSLNTGTEFFFSTTRQTVVKKAVLKPLEVCFALWSSSSIHFKLNLLFTVKRSCSIFIRDLERVNECLRLNSHVKFSSNKVEVAWQCVYPSANSFFWEFENEKWKF